MVGVMHWRPEEFPFVHAGMPVAEKYLNLAGALIGVVFGSAPVAWAIYTGLNKHGGQTKDGLESIGDGIKAGLEAHMTSEGAGQQHLEAGLEKLGQQLSKAASQQQRRWWW